LGVFYFKTNYSKPIGAKMARKSQRIRRRKMIERMKAKQIESLEDQARMQQARMKLEEDNRRVIETEEILKREQEMKDLAAEAEKQRQARTITTGVKKTTTKSTAKKTTRVTAKKESKPKKRTRRTTKTTK
jgi:hypothetical protein